MTIRRLEASKSCRREFSAVEIISQVASAMKQSNRGIKEGKIKSLRISAAVQIANVQLSFTSHSSTKAAFKVTSRKAELSGRKGDQNISVKVLLCNEEVSVGKTGDVEKQSAPCGLHLAAIWFDRRGFLTKQMARRDELLASLPVNAPARSPKHQQSSSWVLFGRC